MEKVNVWQKESVIPALLGVIAFTALTVSGAYIRIPLPFTPVPITLQTFFVLLAGAMLGKRLGTLSQVSYLAIGIFGLPVFTGGLYGFARLFGPTGGFLLGFIGAAYLIGRLLDNENASFLEILTAMFLGQIVLFSVGMAWLAIVLHLSLGKAFILAVLPFIPGDIIKTVAAAVIYQKSQGLAKKVFNI